MTNIVEIPRPRRDHLFENVANVCGMDIKDLTKSSRGMLNKAVSELRDINPDMAELRKRADIYRQLYEGCVLTPAALVKHWPLLKKENHRESVNARDEKSVMRRGAEMGISPKPGESMAEYNLRLLRGAQHGI